MIVPTPKEFDSTNILVFLFRWWKHLGILCVIAIIASAVFSSPRFITPLFQSEVAMFPASTSSLSRAVLGGQIGGRQDFLEYGDVKNAERLLQVLGSGVIRDRVISHFNLAAHYEIKPGARYSQTALRKEYASKISFRRTSFGAVEIKVRDKDPLMAANIANHIAALADTVLNEIRRERALLAYEVARNQYDIVMAEQHKYKDSLTTIMRAGVYDYSAQTEMLTQQLAIDLSRNNMQGVKAIEKQLELIGEYGGVYISVMNHLQNASRNLANLERTYQEALVDLENFVAYKYVIDSAIEAERKVYPVRWLIVFLSTFATVFLGIMVLMVYENLQAKGLLDKAKQ